MPSKLWVVYGWLAVERNDPARARQCFQKAVTLQTSPHAVKLAKQGLDSL